MFVPQAFTAMWRKIETATLVLLLIIAAAVWGFVALASEMVSGDLHDFDEAVLMALRTPGDPSDPIGSHQLEIAMRDVTALGGVTVLTLISLLTLTFLVLQKRRASAVLLGVAILGGQGLSYLTKFTFSRPRPDLVPHGVEVATASFPSGHSMMAAVTYLTLAVMLARVEDRPTTRFFFLGTAALLALAVGCSRVYLGVHWPSDVMAGWTLGAAWALGVALVARAMARRGKIEPDKRGEP